AARPPLRPGAWRAGRRPRQPRPAWERTPPSGAWPDRGVMGGPQPPGRSYPAGMLVARTGLSPVMVGRDAELDRLAQLLGARRRPSVAMIAGDAGVGKTRLIQELVARVPAGTLVLAGQADPGARGGPLELFLDALDGCGTDQHDDLLEVARDRSRTAEERVRAGVALARRLTAGSAGLVVFEDLHWADSESIALFEELTAPDAGQLLLVGSYR